MNATILFVTGLLSAALAVAAGGFVYMLVEPVVPFVTYEYSIPTDRAGNQKDEFRIGEQFFYKRKGVVLKSAPREISQYVVNYSINPPTVVLRLPISSGTANTVGPVINSFNPFVIPEKFTPGDYAFHTDVIYYLNMLRGYVSYEVQLVHFKVVP